MADLEQEWNKTQVTDPLGEEFTYKYYTIGECNPFRVVYDSNGFKKRAESIDLETGQFKRDNALLMRILTSWEVDEIDQPRFDELCEKFRKKHSQKKRITNQE